jgi:ATP-dependent RNA helicase RhlE
MVEAGRKRELLAHLVKKNDWSQVLVFTKTKHGANRLATQLQRDGINADAIHGNKSQNARIRALEDFKEGKVKVLVATDIAARGLDIEELPHVVNFDMSHIPEDYVHRIGRTGRAGSTGEALSLVCNEDRPLLSAIERLINKKIEVRHAEGFEPGTRGAVRHDEPREEAPRERGRGGRGGRGQQQSRQERPQAPRSQSSEGQAPRQQRSEPPAEGRKEPARGEGRQDAGRSTEARPPRGRGGKPREDRAPRYATSPAPRTSGNSGGMDFNKPYEPSQPAVAERAPSEAGETSPRKRPAQAVPALFRKKAA